MAWLIEVEWRIYASVNYGIIGSDHTMSPVQRQAIIWTKWWLVVNMTHGTYFNEILFEIQMFLLKEMHIEM